MKQKHGIRGIPSAEGCLLLFIFVYAFAPFPSHCCVAVDRGWIKLQEAYDVESLVCLFRPIHSFAFSCLRFFVFLKYFLLLRKRRKGVNMDFLDVLH